MQRQVLQVLPIQALFVALCCWFEQKCSTFWGTPLSRRHLEPFGAWAVWGPNGPLKHLFVWDHRSCQILSQTADSNKTPRPSLRCLMQRCEEVRNSNILKRWFRNPIPNHPGCIKNVVNHGINVPTSTGSPDFWTINMGFFNIFSCFLPCQDERAGLSWEMRIGKPEDSCHDYIYFRTKFCTSWDDEYLNFTYLIDFSQVLTIQLREKNPLKTISSNNSIGCILAEFGLRKMGGSMTFRLRWAHHRAAWAGRWADAAGNGSRDMTWETPCLPNAGYLNILEVI